MRTCVHAIGWVVSTALAHAQFHVAGLGGFAALSGAAAAQANPPATSSYNPKVGSAFQLAAGYHFNDWFSVQCGYVGNRNSVVASELAGGVLVQQNAERTMHAVGAEAQLYFRSRSSWVRPYLSAGPAWVRIAGQNRLGLRVAVGADLMHRRTGWGFRYTFSEMQSGNPLGEALRPAATSRLMNFQNLFGIVKQF